MSTTETHPDREDERSKRGIEIVINGRPHVVRERSLTFEEIVSLAFDGNPPQGDQICFTVTYRRGHRPSPSASLQPGEKVKVKKGMVFNVTATDKS